MIADSDSDYKQIYSDGHHKWEVKRLWSLAADLPISEIDPEAFHEWDEWCWEHNLTTLSQFVEHMRRVMIADLQYPIIISAEGNIMDGMHRLAKAALQGSRVRAVRLDVTPPPDRQVG